ncbi:MAG: hypothetical protein HFG05_01350 [Oscillibacter sp.]|nr:hypothetical protein [Oscillibacter sp.]
MCCNRINTDVLLANLFAVSPRRYTETDIRSYLDFLTECFPTYVTSDYSPQRIRECVAQYPELYHATEQDGIMAVSPGELTPKLSYFNDIYPESISSYITRSTESFLNAVPAV